MVYFFTNFKSFFTKKYEVILAVCFFLSFFWYFFSFLTVKSVNIPDKWPDFLKEKNLKNKKINWIQTKKQNLDEVYQRYIWFLKLICVRYLNYLFGKDLKKKQFFVRTRINSKDALKWNFDEVLFKTLTIVALLKLSTKFTFIFQFCKLKK